MYEGKEYKLVQNYLLNEIFQVAYKLEELIKVGKPTKDVLLKLKNNEINNEEINIINDFEFS